MGNEVAKMIYEDYTNIIFVPDIKYDGVLTHKEKYTQLLEELLYDKQYVPNGIITSAIAEMRLHDYIISDAMRYNIDNNKIKLIYDIITGVRSVKDMNLMLGEKNRLDNMFYFYINIMANIFPNLRLSIIFIFKYSNHVYYYDIKTHRYFICDEFLYDIVKLKN